MSTNDKYLVLRGKNKDIYFIQKRVSKKISSIIGKEFIKKSLETNDINIARDRRDKILDELKELELNYTNSDVPIETLKVPVNTSNSSNFATDNAFEKQYVPTNDTITDENEDESDGYFSFIDYSKLPKKEDILNFLDKLFPFAIVFLVIFITLLVWALYEQQNTTTNSYIDFWVNNFFL